MTILVSTAYLDEGEKCDRIILMHNAHILDMAAPAAFRADFDSLEAAMIHRIETVDGSLSGAHFDL